MRANIKTDIKRGIAVGLIAIMAAINPMQTLQPTGAESTTVAKAAETDKAPYIEEIRLAVDNQHCLYSVDDKNKVKCLVVSHTI